MCGKLFCGLLALAMPIAATAETADALKSIPPVFIYIKEFKPADGKLPATMKFSHTVVNAKEVEMEVPGPDGKPMKKKVMVPDPQVVDGEVFLEQLNFSTAGGQKLEGDAVKKLKGKLAVFIDPKTDAAPFIPLYAKDTVVVTFKEIPTK